MKNFSLVVAFDEERGIGKKGGLPWHLPADLRHFKEVTTRVSSPNKKNAVVMGRKTWESLPERFRPLPDRLNVVLTSNASYSVPSNVLLCSSLEEALHKLEFISVVGEIFVIGGAQVFERAIQSPACAKLYVTHITGRFQCDTFFPPIPAGFRTVSESATMTAQDIPFKYQDYER